MSEEQPQLNPIHEWKGVWWFWDEKWSKRIGSYISEIGAEVGLDDYLKNIKENKKDS
jgi:hypothetical protein